LIYQDGTRYRPQTGYYVDVIVQAAALWESLSQNHAFADGNKRVAFAAMFTFLAINGVSLKATTDEAWTFISALHDSGAFRFEQLEEWLRRNCR